MQKHQQANIVVLQSRRSSWLKILSVLVMGMLTTQLDAAESMSDRLLSQHRLYDQSISAEVIEQVQKQTHDAVTLSLEQQRAQENQAQFNVTQIDSSVLTPKQQQKKLEDQSHSVVGFQPRHLPKFKIVNYGISAQNNTVHILTEDRITIYLNPQGH